MMRLWVLAAVTVVSGCAGNVRPDQRRAAFLGQAGDPSAVIATELAFAKEATDKGTWTAFRRYATADAVWPGPNWENVQTALKGVPDPAQPVTWEPDRVWTSCDGSFGFSTGPARWPGGRTARFTTIWQRQDDGSYRWVLDQGFDLEADYGKPEMIAALVADCPAERRRLAAKARRGLAWQSGASDDGTLTWSTTMMPDCRREMVVKALRSGAMVEVFRRTAAAPPPPKDQAAAVCA